MTPWARCEAPTSFHTLPDLLHKRKTTLFPLHRPSHLSLSIFSPRFRSSNPSMSSDYCSSFLSPAPDPALSAGLRSPAPFILSIQAPSNTSLSCSTRWPGPQDFSFTQSSPSLTNTTPSISVQQDKQAQIPFQAADSDSSLSFPANGPMLDHQSHTSPFPYSQHPPFPYNESFERNLKDKQPPRPPNAFILFRSDFLKRKFISKAQETRQHKLSIIAAKCWHKLTHEEKRKWLLEAEREKKAHALKYADYQSQSQSQSQPRARTRTKRGSRSIASSHREPEHLDHLADMAYREIINDIPCQRKRESTTSPSPSTTASLASGNPTPPPRVQWNDLFTLDCYKEQEQPSQQVPLAFSSVGEERQLSLTTSGASDFSTFQDTRMFPTVSHFNASLTSPGTVSHRFLSGLLDRFCQHAVSCNNCSTCLYPDAHADCK